MPRVRIMASRLRGMALAALAQLERCVDPLAVIDASSDPYESASQALVLAARTLGAHDRRRRARAREAIERTLNKLESCHASPALHGGLMGTIALLRAA